MRRTFLLRYHTMSFLGLTFTTTGRPLVLHSFDLSPTSLGGPRPRCERSAAYNRGRHSPSRSPNTHGSSGPNSSDYTVAPHIATSHLRPNVDATMGPAHMPLHHLLPPGCCSDTQHAYALLVVDRYGHLHPLVAPPLPQGPGAKVFAPKTSLAHSLRATTKRPRYSRQRRLFRAFAHHASGQRLYSPFHRPFQPPRRHVRHY